MGWDRHAGEYTREPVPSLATGTGTGAGAGRGSGISPEPTLHLPLPAHLVGAILLIALGLRLVAVERVDLIGADSYRFLAQARAIEEGEWRRAIADSYHPLTAALIAGTNRAQDALLGAPPDATAELRRRERAGVLVSLVAGVLLVALAMGLSARLFPAVSAAGVGLLAAVQPYFVRASADIMSDAVYLACFAAALRWGVIALARPRAAIFALAGLATGLAYLARPEGLLLGPVLAGVWLLARPRPLPLRSLLPRAALAAAAALLLIAPYSAAIGGRITAKKDAGALLGVESGAGSPLGPGIAGFPLLAAGEDGGGETAGGLVLASAAEIVEEWFSTGPEIVAIFAAIGIALALRARPRSLGTPLSLAIAAGHGALLVRLLVHVAEPGYLSRRHVFLLVFLSLPFAVAGIEWASGRLARALSPRWQPRAFPLLLALVATILLPKAIADHRADQVAQRSAAEHILAHGGTGQRIFGTLEKVAYYAGGAFIPLTPEIVEERIAALASEERAWLVFYRERLEEDVPALGALLARPGPALRLEARWREPAAKDGRHLELWLWEKPR